MGVLDSHQRDRRSTGPRRGSSLSRSVALCALLSAPSGSWAASDAGQPKEAEATPQTQTRGPHLELEVLLVNDGDFPSVTVEDARVILEHARATLAEKLAFPDVEFAIKGEESVTSFISRNVDPEGECYQHFEPLRVRPKKRSARQVNPDLVDRFLSRWSVESLAAFFPEEKRDGLDSYAGIRQKLLAEFDRKVELISGFTLADGSSLLPPELLDQRSYVSWICALRNQDDADLILTNAFILYDLASEPYPHSIFAKCKMGGASLLSPKRRAIHRRALVASTFSMVTRMPFFQEEGIDSLSHEERLAVIGTFIVAHEMGHAVFKLPDFYDHPPQCLMTTKLETGYVSGYRELHEHPGPCPLCEPWVDAKRHVFVANEALREKDAQKAIAQLKLAIQMTPKHTDGSYLRYIADLSVKIARAYLLLEEVAQAERWLKAASRIVPEHDEARQIMESLN